MTNQDVMNDSITQEGSKDAERDFIFPMGAFLILGILFVIGIVVLILSGIFTNWRPLNPPPSKPINFMGSSIYFYQANPFVMGVDGVSYICDSHSTSVDGKPTTTCIWKVEVPSEDVTDKECKQGGIKFFGWKKPFNQITDCMEVTMHGEFIGAPTITYVIDSEAKLWYWSQEHSGNMVLYIPIAIIIGIVGGYFLALIWSPISAIVKKREPEYWHALRLWEIKMLHRGGRIGSLASMVYFLVLLLINQRFFSLRNFDPIQTFAILGGMVGLLIAWRWEIAGGGLTMLAFFAALVNNLAGISLSDLLSDFPVFLLAWLPYLPGLLFLLAGVLNNKKTNTNQAGIS
jgi:hypothetical protein